MELIKQIDETITFNENNIRVVGSYDEPWFVAKDICQILDIKDNRSALRIIPDKWKDEQILPSLGGKQITSIINEAGLYKLIAEKFQEAVCEDILPSLRKKGEYKIQNIMDKYEQLEEEKKKIEKENKDLHRLVKRKERQKFRKKYREKLIVEEKIEVKNKMCNTCKVVKPIDNFYNRRVSKDGKDLYCKDCKK